MDETCAGFIPLVLVMCIVGIIFEGYFEKLMMWCMMILAYEVYLRDHGVWQVVVGIGLISFRFTCGHFYLEAKYVVIKFWFVSILFQGLMNDSKSTI